MSAVRDRVRAALVIEHWRSGRRSTEEVARELAMEEEEVCRILEKEGKVYGFSNSKT